MSEINIKQTVENLIDTFLDAGRLSLELRKKGLIKQIKSDNTPVSNGDLEIDKLITSKINQLNPDIPLVSEETSENKFNTNLKNFWLVDPIDGTFSFASGVPLFGCLIGLLRNNKPLYGSMRLPFIKNAFISGDSSSKCATSLIISSKNNSLFIDHFCCKSTVPCTNTAFRVLFIAAPAIFVQASLSIKSQLTGSKKQSPGMAAFLFSPQGCNTV